MALSTLLNVYFSEVVIGIWGGLKSSGSKVLAKGQRETKRAIRLGHILGPK